MSCPSLRHHFDEERQKGVTFEKAMEIFQDVEGSVAAHKAELAEIMKSNKDQAEINHLKEHIEEGESLLQEIKSLSLH